jgi:hypothetical protein
MDTARRWRVSVMADPQQQVRELHKPMGDDRYPKCEGCDADGWEAEYPDWPCRTADIVYDASEIQAVKDRAEAAREKWRTEQAERPPAPLFPDSITRGITRQMEQESLIRRITNRVNGRTTDTAAESVQPPMQPGAGR